MAPEPHQGPCKGQVYPFTDNPWKGGHCWPEDTAQEQTYSEYPPWAQPWAGKGTPILPLRGPTPGSL